MAEEFRVDRSDDGVEVYLRLFGLLYADDTVSYFEAFHVKFLKKLNKKSLN